MPLGSQKRCSRSRWTSATRSKPSPAARSSVRLTRRTRAPAGALSAGGEPGRFVTRAGAAALGVEEEADAPLLVLDAGLDAVAQLGLDRVLHPAGEADAARAR